MKKLVLLALLTIGTLSCDKDEEVCYKSAHVSEDPSFPEFSIIPNYPYDCDTGEPLQDLAREQQNNPKIVWIRWGS